MVVLGVILARAGSKGLPDKCVRALLGRPVIAYTFDHARTAETLTDIVLTTDSEAAKRLARDAGLDVVDRPAELACDTATVDAAARHAVLEWERGHLGRAVNVIVLLYGNIPVRAEGVIDRAVRHLTDTGAESVRTVAPVSKQHPDWIHRLDGDRMRQFRVNSIYRRQDLEPLHYHDGAVCAVTRDALFGALRTPEDHQSFLGQDRRAIVQRCEDAVDIDEPIDFFLAEALLRARGVAPAPDGRCSDRGQAETIDGALSPCEPSSTARGPEPGCDALSSITIGARRIGVDEPVFVIAEAGVNHDGDPRKAMKLIDAAREAGADAVKFQWFRAEDLVCARAPSAAYQRQACRDVSQRDMLHRLELRAADFTRLKSHCDDRGIVFLATPFGPTELDQVVELGAPAVKIASTDVNNEPLLRRAASTGLPVLLSTGASLEEEVAEAVEWFQGWNAGHRLVLLHCVSCYPAPLEAVNLKAIDAMKRRFGSPVGFSDHTTSTLSGALSVMAGACVVEKHLTLDRGLPGPDHAMSLDPGQFREYVRRIRDAESAGGEGKIGFTAAEREVRMIARRSVTAAVHIAAGEALVDSNLTLKRPGTGIAPRDVSRLVGRTATVDIPRDTLLTWDMVR